MTQTFFFHSIKLLWLSFSHHFDHVQLVFLSILNIQTTSIKIIITNSSSLLQSSFFSIICHHFFLPFQKLLVIIIVFFLSFFFFFPGLFYFTLQKLTSQCRRQQNQLHLLLHFYNHHFLIRDVYKCILKCYGTEEENIWY